MAMRYLVRRTKPEDISEIKKEVKDLDTQLDKPGEHFRRDVFVRFDNLTYCNYQFATRKDGAGWVWVCPTIELVSENETGLFKMTEKLGVPIPSHLAHLK